MLNYFNYFTEIEEHFQRARGTGSVPAVAARLGADRKLEERRRAAGSGAARHRRGVRKVARAQGEDADGELAGLLRAGRADRSADHGRAVQPRGRAGERAPPFRSKSCARISKATPPPLPAGYEEIAASLRKLAAEAEEHYADLEGLEQRLTVLEEKMIAAARAAPDRRSRCWSRAASSIASCAPIAAR